MKKIAIILNGLTAGGAERVVSRLSYPLAEKYELYIILLENTEQFYDCAGKKICLSRGYSAHNLLGKFLSLKQTMKKYQFDVVFSFLRVPNLMNILCRNQAKTVISIRCYIDKRTDTGFMTKCKHVLEKVLYRYADEVVAVSKLTAWQMQDEYHVRPDKLHVIENPYDKVKIQKECGDGIEKEVEDFISRHQTVATMGRLTEIKGCRHLVEIIYIVSQTLPSIGLLVLGEGADKAYIRKRVDDLGLSDNVLFLGNKKSPFAYIGKCSLFASASSLEGFPNALIEAMCCRLPVIFSDCRSGPREILSEKEQNCGSDVEYAAYGVLAPDFANEVPGTGNYNEKIKNFAGAIIKLLSDSELLSHYSEKAAERAELYSMDRCIKKYCEIIEK